MSLLLRSGSLEPRIFAEHETPVHAETDRTGS